MKTAKKAAVMLLSGVMMLPVFACSHGESSATPGFDLPITENSDGSFSADLTFANDFKDDEHTGGDSANYIVTTLRGDDGQAYVQKTDVNGTGVTEQGGKPVTEVYTGTTLATSYAQAAYTPVYKNHQSFWFDTSKQADYVFDGELLVFEFKVNDDAVDGVYPIQFYFADVANWDAKDVDVTMNVGYICINAEQPKNEQATGSGLTINPATVSAKQGETVRVPINITNNSGFVGFRLRMRYDSKAITITDAGAGKDLHSRAGLTALEIGDNK